MNTKEIYDIVYGHKIGPNIKEWCDELFFKLCFTRAKYSPLNPKIINRRLASLGYTPEEIYTIRDIFVESTKTAISRLQFQNPDEVPAKYVASGAHWYGAYQLFLNVDDKFHKEKDELVSKLFILKLEKLAK